jgi:hypothetical protein
MPSNLNDRVPREQAKIPNVRNWAVRDYGNRVGIWRLMEVPTRYGIRASAALNSEVCDHHPEIIEEGGKLGREWIGHNQTNALRLTEVDPAAERAAVRATIDRIEAASGTRPLGWLGAGLAETWNTLDYLTEAGIRYVCDWVNDDQPYQFEIGTPPLVSLPYSVQTIMCLSLLTLPLIGGLVALPHLDHTPLSLSPHNPTSNKPLEQGLLWGMKTSSPGPSPQLVGSMSPMFCGLFVSRNQSSAGVDRMSDHKSTRHDVGTLLSKTSAMLAQNTRRREPSACARSLQRSGPRQ